VGFGRGKGNKETRKQLKSLAKKERYVGVRIEQKDSKKLGFFLGGASDHRIGKRHAEKRGFAAKLFNTIEDVVEEKEYGVLKGSYRFRGNKIVNEARTDERLSRRNCPRT